MRVDASRSTLELALPSTVAQIVASCGGGDHGWPSPRGEAILYSVR